MLWMELVRFESPWFDKLSKLLLLLFLSLTVGVSPCLSAEKSNGPAKFVSIPVLYLTDREQTGGTYGAHRRYPSNCKHHLYYGTAAVNQPNTKQANPDDKWAQLGWKASETGTLKISAKETIDPANPETCKDEFFSRLNKALEQSGKTELCVFVHGAADAFEDCLLDAAELAYNIEKPVVLYSWPSDPKRRGYFIDGTNIEWSQAHFNQFCKDLVAFQSKHPLQIVFVSHSMGNRLVIRALPVMYGKGLVTDWELVSPDIDSDTCRHYVMDYPNVQGKIRIYVSNRDKMLPLAQMLSGGYYRLGEAANPTLQPSAAKARFLERIDFTAIDTGLTGHSIPFELIANMVHNDKPGAGLGLVEESSVRASRFARLAGRSQDMSATSSESDICKRVVKVK